MDANAIARSRAGRRAGAIVLVILGMLCVFANDFVARVTLYEALNRSTGVLIDEALEENQVAFLGLTAVKASMALIEGSSVGLDFELEVGDIIQPAYDYVDFFGRCFCTHSWSWIFTRFCWTRVCCLWVLR